MSDHPLISCIMPTANRRHFVAQAVRYFLAQDYPAKELIVFDDGTETAADLMPADPRVIYLRSEQRHPLREKRVLCGQAARGKLSPTGMMIGWHPTACVTKPAH